MKSLKNIIIALIVCQLCMTSCEDYLKETPNGRIMSDQAFSRPTDLEGAVNILYRRMGRSMFNITQYINSQMGDDLCTHRASNKPAIRQWDLMDIGTANDRTLMCWQDKYLVIKAANFIINGVENTPGVSQADIDYALGQAHFWRGWAYFYLVRAFGPLPKIVSLEIDFSIELSTVAEIYELVVEDLKKAEGLLPANYTGAPRSMNGVNVAANKGAVQSLLACVYMTMAGWPLEYGAAYYDLAAEKALEVIRGAENGTYYYKLYDEYWKIHSKQENLKNTEAICAAYFSLAFGPNDSSESARGGINDLPDCAQGWTDSAAEIGFWVDFPAGPRKDATYPEWTNYGVHPEDVLDAAGNVIAQQGDWRYYRWWDERLPEADRHPYFGKSAFTNSDAEYDFKKRRTAQSGDWYDQIHQAVRLAEVYLWYAESVGRAGKTNADAIKYLNIVRNRADGFGPVADRSTVGIPSKPHVAKYVNEYPNSMSANELAEAAYNEHGWEIAGWYWGAFAPRANDQQRMNRLQAVFEKRKSNPVYTFTDPYDPTNTTPISVREMYVQAPEVMWHQGRMFAPYPFQEVEKNELLNITWEQKLQLIK